MSIIFSSVPVACLTSYCDWREGVSLILERGDFSVVPVLGGYRALVAVKDYFYSSLD